MNVKGTDAAGGGTGGYWNKKIGDVVDELPEAEVEVISPGTESDDSGWFYQEPSSGNNNQPNDNDWFYQNNNTGTGETAYNEIYYAPNDYNEYDNTPYSSGSSSQKTEQSVLQNIVEQPNPQPEPQTTAEQEAAAYVNAVLGQQANTRPGPIANQNNNSLISPVFDEDALRRSIQQSIEQANAEANVNAQQGKAQNAQNMQNLLEWDWRNVPSSDLNLPLNNKEAMAFGANQAIETAQNITNMLTGNTPKSPVMEYLTEPNRTESATGVQREILENLPGANPPTPTTIENAIEESAPLQRKGGNMQLPPNYRATDSNSGTSMLEKYVEPVQEQRPYFFNEQYLSDLAAGLVDESFSPETLAELYGGYAQNPGWDGIVGETRMSGYNRAEEQHQEPASPSLGSRILSALGNGAHEVTSDYDQAIQDAAGLIGSFIINNSGTDPEYAKMNRIEEMMFADGISPVDISPRSPLWAEYEKKFDEMYPEGVEAPVSEITPEYFTEKANNKINEFGTGLENSISSAIESIADSIREDQAKYNEADMAAARLGLEPGSPEYYAFIDNYVSKSTPQNASDLSPENQRAEQLRTRQLENAIQENANVDMSAQTERDYGSGAYGVPGYNYDGSMNPTLQSVLAGERTINQTPDGRPGYNADGTPNDMLKALLNGEFISDATIGELAATYPEHYETLRRSNADGMLALFDATFGQSAAGFEGITIPKEIEQFIASNAGKALGQLELGYLDGNGNLNILRNEDIEYVKASGEDYDKAIDTLISANKVLQDMISAGLVTRDDIARHFFKGLSETKEEEEKSTKKSYGGGGGGYKKSSGGGSRRGGYGGGGSSNYGYAPSDKEQKQARVNNIMKNWTF